MSAVVSGIIGGIVATILTVYIRNRVGRSASAGQLRFGRFMWVLAFACLSFALLPTASTLAGNDRDFWAKLALTVGFGLAAIYCMGEAAFVRGTYDQDGIDFSTPWTGRKHEKWEDLVSIERNEWLYWYVLSFKSGKKIRFSDYLGGHQSALDVASQHMR